MASPIVHPVLAILLDLAAKQHGVVLRRQLVKAGLSASAIKHRIARGDLHPLWRGVYAVGRPDVDSCGRWMAATLVCGPRAALSHESAAELWQLRRSGEGPIHVSVRRLANHRRLGIALHRRRAVGPGDITRRLGIPVTGPACTLVDLATHLSRSQLEAAVIEADGLTYHRTPTQQAKDRVRDQAHSAAGLTTLRFTHAQVAHQREHVEAVLTAVAKRLSTVD